MATGVIAVCYTTHTIRRNGCQGFFFSFLAATNRCTLNVEVSNPAGQMAICACEMQRVITVQLLYCVKVQRVITVQLLCCVKVQRVITVQLLCCVKVYLVLNKIIHKYSLICYNIPSKLSRYCCHTVSQNFRGTPATPFQNRRFKAIWPRIWILFWNSCSY
jgi:hypothetical protein